LEIAINALGRVKQYMPNAVGGSLVAVQLNHDGTENFYDAREINRIEKYTKEFDLLTRSLLLCFMDFRTSHDFDQNLKVFSERVAGFRKEWFAENKEHEGMMIFPPQEIIDAFEKRR
jgi:hypothetical protein